MAPPSDLQHETVTAPTNIACIKVWLSDAVNMNMIPIMQHDHLASNSVYSPTIWRLRRAQPCDALLVHHKVLHNSGFVVCVLLFEWLSPILASTQYWGKASKEFNTPINSSVSVTLDQDDLRAITSVCASKSFTSDRLWYSIEKESFDSRCTY
jgi:hypothetical protein